MNEPDSNTAVPSIFTRIISGELPGHFVYRDDRVVAMLTIAPIRPGHVMVVPIDQIDHWTDVPADLWAHVSEVSRIIGKAQMAAFNPARIGTMILGMEVPHCHIHLVPIDHESDLSFANADNNVSQEQLADVAEQIRSQLRSAGHAAVVPES